MRIRAWWCCLAIAGAGSLAGAGDTWFVPDDFPTIQAAIDGAADGDSVRVRPGVYAERVVWWFKAIDVASTDGAAATVIDASDLGPGRVVELLAVPAGGALRGFTITGGSGGGGGAGMYVQGGAPLVRDCVLVENHAGDRFGGGVLCFGTLGRFERCEFRGNSAWSGGGAHVYGHAGFADCLFEGNHAETGGAISTQNSSSLFERCEFRRNTADFGGSAITVGPSPYPSIADSLFCAQAEPQIAGEWQNRGGNAFEDECPLDCLADFNGDGGVNTLDVLGFLNAWSAGDGAADINGDGNVDTLDVLAFLNVWNLGC